MHLGVAVDEAIQLLLLSVSIRNAFPCEDARQGHKEITELAQKQPCDSRDAARIQLRDNCQALSQFPASLAIALAAVCTLRQYWSAFCRLPLLRVTIKQGSTKSDRQDRDTRERTRHRAHYALLWVSEPQP
jgi:hypothetical protein